MIWPLCLWMMWLTSYVTLRLVCKIIGVNLIWGSAVSQSRKSLWGSKPLSSFSRDGSQVVTRCRFLRQSQWPKLEHSFSSLTAFSLWPWPIATWRYKYLPSVRKKIGSLTKYSSGINTSELQILHQKYLCDQPLTAVTNIVCGLRLKWN